MSWSMKPEVKHCASFGNSIVRFTIGDLVKYTLAVASATGFYLMLKADHEARLADHSTLSKVVQGQAAIIHNQNVTVQRFSAVRGAVSALGDRVGALEQKRVVNHVVRPVIQIVQPKDIYEDMPYERMGPTEEPDTPAAWLEDKAGGRQ